ncbi:SMP-30/gluconolactonase/LRE family protein [Pseudomonas abietaniphila]
MIDADEKMENHPFVEQLLNRWIEDLIQEGSAREIASDLGCAEGPAWIAECSSWIFSDIPNNALMTYSTVTGRITSESPSHYSNGHYPLRSGGYVSCEHLTRCVSHTNGRGIRKIICDRYNGARLNSPNDLVERSDGSLWFTDPTYGILSDAEGARAPSEQPHCGVYSFKAISGELTLEIANLKMPNGLAFSPDERTLYVADSGADGGPGVPFNPRGPREIMAYSIDSSGHVVPPGSKFCQIDDGIPDGVRCDAAGYVWVATGAGIECFDPNGTSMGILFAPETATNLAFGGPSGLDVMITCVHHVYLISLQTTNIRTSCLGTRTPARLHIHRG